MANTPNSRPASRRATTADTAGHLSTGAHVLLVEDEPGLREMLVRVLLGAGYHVDAVGDGQVALRRALTYPFDVLVIDRGLPGIEGIQVVRQLRAEAIHTPILILSGHADVTDRVAGLDAGAEDYLAKPFEIDELLARLRSLLRRGPHEISRLTVGNFTLDRVTRIAVRTDGTQAELSGREIALIQTLAAQPRHVFTRTELRIRVFASATSDAIVDTYIHYLRRKLGTDIIHTIRGIGYRLGSG